MGLSAYYQTCKLRKPEPRKRTKARKDRTEAKVEKAVRRACVARDGSCRVCDWELNPDDTHEGDGGEDALPYPSSEFTRGDSEWSHIETRARTRKMKPELRHNTATSVILCRFHHDRLDGRARPRLHVTLLTGRGADGPLQWRTS